MMAAYLSFQDPRVPSAHRMKPLLSGSLPISCTGCSPTALSLSLPQCGDRSYSCGPHTAVFSTSVSRLTTPLSLTFHVKVTFLIGCPCTVHIYHVLDGFLTPEPICPPADGEKLVGGRRCPSVATLENCSFPEEAPDKEALKPLPEGPRPQEATRSFPPSPFQKEFRNWTTRSQGPPLILPVQSLVLSPDGSRGRPPAGLPSPRAAERQGASQCSMPGRKHVRAVKRSWPYRGDSYPLTSKLKAPGGLGRVR